LRAREDLACHHNLCDLRRFPYAEGGCRTEGCEQQEPFFQPDMGHLSHLAVLLCRTPFGFRQKGEAAFQATMMQVRPEGVKSCRILFSLKKSRE
jgi:hypothetical protein